MRVRSSLFCIFFLALCALIVIPAPVKTAVVATKIADNGGSVDWYKGPAGHDRIAFEAVVDPATRNTQVFTMNPDGTGQQCVTCGTPVPNGFMGNATWHPDGEHLLFQVENANSGHTAFNNQFWGFDNDLWIIKTDGTGAAKVWTTPPGFSALYPHFNRQGTKIAFSQRVPGPAPQNPYDRWSIVVADFDITQPPGSMISNVTSITPSGQGIYEVSDLPPNDRVIYAYTAGGAAYIDDIYIANLNGTGAVNLINSPTTWEEFGYYSPTSAFVFAFMSNRFNPAAIGASLRTELYLRITGQPARRITFFNPTSTSERVIVSKIDWRRTGRSIVMQVFRPATLVNEVWTVSF